MNDIDIYSPWIKWSISAWDPVLKNAKKLHFKKNDTIFNQGSPSEKFYIVFSGRVRIVSYSKEGSEKHLYIAEKGCIFCESSIISDMPFFSSAIAITDCQIYEIDKDLFLNTLTTNLDFNLEFIRFICRKNMMFTHQITQLSFTQSLQRVSATLIDLCNQYGVKENNCIRISIRFTHQDVANIVNSTRVTVSNLFRYLIDEGVLDRPSSYFIVTDIDKLKKIANNDT